MTYTINAQMKTVNDALYPQQRRKSPLFSFKAATKGVSYTFDHNGDTGSGAQAKNLIIFDLAVLRSTPLPFLIHDSAIIKPVAFAPVRKLLIDRDMTREDLRHQTGLSPATIAKLGRDGNVTTDVLARICAALDCTLAQIAEVVNSPDKEDKRE
ncbi:DUF2326 domain-containing protein [Arcanobacterium canis]